MKQGDETLQRDQRWINGAVLTAAVVLAVASARPHAGGWNDGSRLATVECLVDYHTLAIEKSIFVQVPQEEAAVPYPVTELLLCQKGTADKLFIQGRFYSDKSPVPALLLSGFYRGVQTLTGLSTRQSPHLFCFVLTLASSGLAYVVSIWCVHALGGALGLSSGLRLMLTASLGLATVALPYTEYVNNHILLLGVSAVLMLGLVRLHQARDAGRMPWGWMIALGSLAGLGYTIDLGAGPVLLLSTTGLLAWRCRCWGAIALFGLAVLPWLILHHAVNYAVGGTLAPANAVPDYFQWPGCPFTPQQLTGGWKHNDLTSFLVYALALLGGKRGFLGHNLPLFLILPCLWFLLRRRHDYRAEVVFAVCTCVGVWLMYAVNSNNSSGQCLTIRWFVPLLAPSFFLLALLLREEPRCLIDLAILSSWGVVLTLLGWWYGPWIKHMVPLFWPLQAAALASWAGYHLWLRSSLSAYLLRSSSWAETT